MIYKKHDSDMHRSMLHGSLNKQKSMEACNKMEPYVHIAYTDTPTAVIN